MSDSEVVIKVENLWKQYRYGTISHATMKKDLQSWWARCRGKPDPNTRIDLDQARSTKNQELRTKNQSLDGDSFWALEDISFDVKQGEIIGIIGKNGAGKSTLLKIMSRVTTPTRGQIKIKGRVSSLLEIGTGFHPELTGRENIFLNGAIMGMNKTEIRRKLDEIVDFAEVENFVDTPVKRYSSGMYVRLAFAVAAHLEPEILLVDEVLAVGDASFQKKCLGKMGNVAKEGRTVLFVSHNMVAMQSLCPHVIWLHDGQLKEVGKSAQVISDYLHLNTSSLTTQAWDEIETAPGNDTVRLHRVCVRTVNGSPSNQITMQTPLEIEVEYWNLKADMHLHITLHLYTEQGVVAFTTGSGREPRWSGRPLPAGLYRSTCYIPGNLLNSGGHRVLVLVVKDLKSVIYQKEDALSFDVADLTERQQGSWFGKEAGAVQPLLKWTTEYLVDTADTTDISNESIG